ncbi:MAG: hypothetical protein JKY94_00420 [Rhodobacteraceae bacterium]|nr:hypothetical protein [Paracoccaceae bacterium]
MTVRDTVMKSLNAIGSSKEAAFYAKVFQQQEPERFALIVVDPRCLKNPLLEALISDLKILSNLDLTPVLLIGALDTDHTSVRFQAQRLCRALDGAGIPNDKLNCASYEFIAGVHKITGKGRFAVLELTETGPNTVQDAMNLRGLTIALQPFKVIFLQPSGGFRIEGQRVPVVNIDQIDEFLTQDGLSDGQTRVVDMVKTLADEAHHHCTYVIASPLNLLSELFTVRGAGTMLRRGAKILSQKDYKGLNVHKLQSSIEGAFGESLVGGYLKRPILHICVEENYRGGAIVTKMKPGVYLNKFWVTQEAQGEGIARDIWQVLEENVPAFFWRSKKNNPFNHWYMKVCDGMQVSGTWRIFWKGLGASEIPDAILAASNAPVDFEEKQ